MELVRERISCLKYVHGMNSTGLSDEDPEYQKDSYSSVMPTYYVEEKRFFVGGVLTRHLAGKNHRKRSEQK